MAAGRVVAAGRMEATAHDRVGYMQDRLDRRLEKAGLEASARARVLDASGRAMKHRAEVLREDSHFEVLHPGRTMLILLDDCGVANADVLAAAATVETAHAGLRVAAANTLASQVPVPNGGDELLEELIALAPSVRLIALAERLDHARHLHLRPPAAWPDFHHTIDGVYSPVAERSHALLARRYAWWTRTFQRRFLAPVQPI